MKKKLLLVLLAAVGGWLAYRRLQNDEKDHNLWAEAGTDPVAPTGGLR
ncbi:MAG TPA: DLW-39 family protein [Actinopolymorphaceae bacterium]|jgi:hypothetical protein